MPWLIKDTRDGEHASAFRCPDHVDELLDDESYDLVLEGPWELRDDEPPPFPGFFYYCEKDHCGIVLDHEGTYRPSLPHEDANLILSAILHSDL